MIHLVEGTPGSGKSYYAVNYLLSNFFEYDNFYNEYKEKENKNVLVISNIEDLKVKHLNLDVLIDRFSLEKFFTIENFERIQKQYKVKNIVLIIDEAQRYFDRKFYNKDVFYFFQYHRHLGVDIFLITQSKNTISKEIVVLSEYIVKAIPRSVQPNVFIYHFYDVDGNKLFTKSLRKDKKVFYAYSSMKTEEITKPKNVVFSKLAVYSSIIVLSVFVLFYSLHHFWGSPARSEVSKKSSSVDEVKKKIQKQVKDLGVPDEIIDQVENASNGSLDTKAKLQAYIKEANNDKIVIDNSEYKMISTTRDGVDQSRNWICLDGTNQCYVIFEK